MHATLSKPAAMCFSLFEKASPLQSHMMLRAHGPSSPDREHVVHRSHNLNYGADLIGRAMASTNVGTTVSPTYAREVCPLAPLAWPSPPAAQQKPPLSNHFLRALIELSFGCLAAHPCSAHSNVICVLSRMWLVAR